MEENQTLESSCSSVESCGSWSFKASVTQSFSRQVYTLYKIQFAAMRKNERVAAVIAAVVAMTILNNHCISVNRLPQSKQPCKPNSQILEKFCEIPSNES